MRNTTKKTLDKLSDSSRGAAEYLSQLYLISEDISIKREQLSSLKSIAEGTASRDFTKERVTGGKSIREDAMCECIRLEEKLENRLNDLYSLQDKIDAQLNGLESALECIVLKKKYLLFKTNAAIAEELCYSDRHIRRVVRNALENFSEIYLK